MIEVNKNTLASAIPALGKLICRTSPLMLCKSIKIESENGKLRLSTCGLNEEVSYELETSSEDIIKYQIVRKRSIKVQLKKQTFFHISFAF